MGQRIWAVLDQYAGMWVTIDKAGAVVDSAATLPELTGRAGDNLHRLTFVFAAGTRREAEAAV
jgi:hypothetical protein